VEVDDADVLEFRGARDERVEQDGRRRGRTLEIELVSGSDARDGLLRGHDSHALSLG
jgi:hypothetical protein